MVVPLQYLGVNGLGELVLALLVPLLVVAFGSYVGVLMALQTFFEADSWTAAVESARGQDGE
jgi:hypothetical protein